jgi:hypothetical protein
MNGEFSPEALFNTHTLSELAYKYLRAKSRISPAISHAKAVGRFIANCTEDQNVVPHLGDALLALLAVLQLIADGYKPVPAVVGWVEESIVRFSDAIGVGDLPPDFKAVSPFYYHMLCEWEAFLNNNDDG